MITLRFHINQLKIFTHKNLIKVKVSDEKHIAVNLCQIMLRLTVLNQANHTKAMILQPLCKFQKHVKHLQVHPPVALICVC